MKHKQKKGHLFIISGPSGAGKGSVIGCASKKININVSVSVTSRPKRANEIDGKDYFFVSDKKFDELIAGGKLLEWAELYGNKYGTPEEQVNILTQKGEDVFLEIDVQGARQVKLKRPDSVLIFIKPPSLDELKRRLKARGSEDDAEIEKRFVLAEDEILSSKEYDFVIVNEDLNEASDRLIRIVKEVGQFGKS